MAKDVLLGRLLIDWQVTDPIYRTANESSAAALGAGPWVDFSEVVYGPDEGSPHTPLGDMSTVIEILEGVQDEPWTDALYLTELYLPRLRAATPEQAAGIGEALSASLLTDPRDYMTRVEAPVLAFFGERDVVQPSETSAMLFDEYLTAAGNRDVTIVMIPDVGHDINWTTPGYTDTVSAWLRDHARA